MTVVVDLTSEKPPENSEISFIQIDLGKNATLSSDFTKDAQLRSRSSCCHVSRKKCFIISAVVVCLLTALLFAAGAYFYFTAEQIFLNDRKQISSHGSDQDVIQETHLGSKENIVKYIVIDHITGLQVNVLIDANRGLQIHQMESNASMACYVSPIITNDLLEGVHISELGQLSSFYNISNTQPKRTITISKSPIKDTSVLGPKGQELCATDNVYWSNLDDNIAIDQTNNQPDSLTSDDAVPPQTQQQQPQQQPQQQQPQQQQTQQQPRVRRKRATQQYFTCFWDANSCYYITYPDDIFHFRYYTCAVRCGFFSY